MIDVLIRDAIIVTMNGKRETLYEHSLAIDQGRILEIGPVAEMDQKYLSVEKVIEAKGKIVFPGLVNTHNHLFQTLLKGLGDDKVLSDWLSDMTFPSSTHLTQEDCYTGALIGTVEGIHSGVTTQLDYMYPHPRENLSDGVLKAFKELGVRGILARGYMDDGFQFGVRPQMAQTVDVIEKDVRRLAAAYHNTENERLKIWLAPAAVWSNSAASLNMTRDLANEIGTGITIHISETPFDRAASEELHGLPDIDVMEKMGIMGPNFLMVHCVYLTDRDIRMSKIFDAKISHNPVSNMYLSSGVPPIPKFNVAGLTVGLGTDGAGSNNSNDMIELLKMTALLQKVTHRDPTIMTAGKVLEMATIEGAKALGLDHEIGSLEVGKKADLFLFDPALDMKAIPMHNPISTLIYSSGNKNVETVLIDGKVVMENSIILGLNESALAASGQATADDLARRAGTDHLKKRPFKSLAY
ncbi:amidohydrolase [Clostridia bacterium]|nr:amidohydrolase [Clostridia bacterium]